MTAELVNNLFRSSAGQMVAALTRWMGARYLDLAEECVQDALVRALETWPFRGVPENPRAWLIQTAKHKALDRLRRERAGQDLLPRVEHVLAHPGFGPEIDDQLGLIFLCCHPALPAESRVALTLKAVGGFGVREIARALLAQENAVQQRLVRAKRQIREQELQFDLLEALGDTARQAPVLDVLYLLFNEGYTAHAGEHLLRRDVSEEAIRLARLLLLRPETATPSAYALLSLFLLQSARDAARTDETGALYQLREQDRTKWDAARIREGFACLDRASAAATELTALHLEAAIASVHAIAPKWESTDWATLAGYYDRLLELRPQAVVALNRAVAVAEWRGARAGLDALEPWRDDPTLRHYHLLPAILADLHRRLGHRVEAAAHYAEALRRPASEPERRFLEARLAELSAR
jgi:RNA polymerase sigma-70 factor (ECF subfamily)